MKEQVSVSIKKNLLIQIFICVSFLSVSCMSLSSSEKKTLKELNSYGIKSEAIEIKKPVTAGALNLLPGFGNFYLAFDEKESGQVLLGIVNFLLWPTSIIWGVAEATIDAGTMNKRETAFYYTYNKRGRSIVEKRKAEISK